MLQLSPYLALRGVHGCSKLLEPPMVKRCSSTAETSPNNLPTAEAQEKTSWNESANKIKLHLIIYNILYIIYCISYIIIVYNWLCCSPWGPQTVVFTSTACCSFNPRSFLIQVTSHFLSHFLSPWFWGFGIPHWKRNPHFFRLFDLLCCLILTGPCCWLGVHWQPPTQNVQR